MLIVVFKYIYKSIYSVYCIICKVFIILNLLNWMEVCLKYIKSITLLVYYNICTAGS